MYNNIGTNKKNKCFGCGACANICPKDAITLCEDEKGFLYPNIDKEKCIDCGKCKKVCYFYDKNKIINKPLHFYAVKHKNEKIRKVSTSGGAFTALAEHIINNNGVVYGATYDKDMVVFHERIDTVNGLNKLRGSKYVQSKIDYCFSKIERDLKDGLTVLFTGTPCQAAAIKLYFKDRYQKLILCDIVCHGTPSPKTFRDHINFCEQKTKKKIIDYQFRIKDYGWHSTNHIERIKYKGGKNDSKTALSQSFKYLFYSCKTLRDSCFECPFANVDRVADITIGDFWGIEKYYKEFDDNTGISLMIINTPKGADVFEKINTIVDYIETDKEKSLQHNLIKPTNKPKGVEQFWQEYNVKGYRFILKKYTPYGIKNRCAYYVKNIIKKIIGRK